MLSLGHDFVVKVERVLAEHLADPDPGWGGKLG
jgi:hypothetical protein